MFRISGGSVRAPPPLAYLLSSIRTLRLKLVRVFLTVSVIDWKNLHIKHLRG